MRNLLGRLHERSAGSLAVIARYWGVELRGRDLHQDVGHLFSVMTDPWSFPMAFERLESTQQELLYWMADTEKAWTGLQIAELEQQEYRIVRERLIALYRAGFLFDERSEAGVDEQGDTRLLVPRELTVLLRRVRRERTLPDPDTCTLDELLDRLDDAELGDLAGRLGYTVVPSVAMREDLIAYIRPRLSDPDRLTRVRQRLIWPESALFEWLETTGRAYPSSARTSLGMTMAELRAGIDALVSRGLIWRGYDDRGKIEIVLPSAIRHPAPMPVETVPELEIIDEQDVELPEWRFPFPAAWDLLTVLRETQIARSGAMARVLRDGGSSLGATASSRLARILWNAGSTAIPPGYLWFLSALSDSVAEGLSSTGGAPSLLDESDPPGLTDSVRPWTRLSFPEQQERMVASWLRWVHPHEVRGRETIEVWGARWPAFRERLTEHLRELEPERWYTLSSFTKRFASQESDALGTQFTAAINREPVDGSVDARRRDVVQYVAELNVLTACSWLHLIETARTRRHGYVFRLTDVGEWSLGRDLEPPETPAFGQSPVAVQPTQEVLLLQPQPRLVWALSGFADLETLDRVSTFRLSAASIHRALDAGVTIDQLLRAMERHGGDVPGNVVDQIRDWETHYRRARLGFGLIIELSHPGEMARLHELLIQQDVKCEQLDPGKLIVRVPALDRAESIQGIVRSALRQLGITVRWRS